MYLEVVFLAVCRIEIDVNRDFKFLVVRLIDQLHIAHDTDNRLSLRPQFFYIHGNTLIVHYIVGVVKRYHFFHRFPVYHEIDKHFIIGQRLLVDTD